MSSRTVRRWGWPGCAAPEIKARIAVAVLLGGLAGCHLVDQRDFDRNAGRPPPKPPVPRALPPPPALVTITYDRADPNYAPNYAQELANAVQLALARKPNVIFTVETLVPVAGSPRAQADQARQGVESGRQVASSIVADGADEGQIELAVRADPGQGVKQVLVLVH